jgi:hypothetical protein
MVRRMKSTLRTALRWRSLAVVALALCAGGAARAGESLPVIVAGREPEVLDLLKPYGLGTRFGDGWIVDNIAINGEFVRVLALGPKGEKAAVRFDLPKRSPSPETTPSFAVHRELDPKGPQVDPKVLDPIVEAVRKNDNGKFWPAHGPVPRDDKTGLKAHQQSTSWRRLRRPILAVTAAVVAALALFLERRRSQG